MSLAEDQNASGSAAPDDLVRRFVRLSTWNILANLTVPLVGLVDAAMLGHLEDIRYLAGVALGAIVFDYVFWTFGFLRMATTGLVAQAVGRDDAVEVERVFQRSALIALTAGGAILLLRDPLGGLAFSLLSGEAATEAAGRAYFDARVLGAPAALLNFVLLGWFLGREDSRTAMLMTVVANLANLALDYLFILELGWAARGAGLATMASQYLMLAVGLVFYLRQRRRVEGSLRSLLDLGRLATMFGLQRDILIRTLCLVSAFAVFTDFSARLGTDVLAANTLLLKIVTLAAFFIDGAAFAVESLAGVLHGAGDRVRLRRLLGLSLATGLAFASLIAAAVVLGPRLVLGVLTTHAQVVDLGVGYRLWLLPVLFFGSLAYILDGLFLGLTAGKILRNAMLVSVLGVFLPTALIALARTDAHLLWAALAAFMVARVLTLGRAVRRLDALSAAP